MRCAAAFTAHLWPDPLEGPSSAFCNVLNWYLELAATVAAHAPIMTGSQLEPRG